MAGVLSVGGTSIQLTSKVEENQAPEDGVRLQLYGQMHNVYTRHCPCHGTDQLRSRLLSMLIQVSICQKGICKIPGYGITKCQLHEV